MKPENLGLLLLFTLVPLVTWSQSAAPLSSLGTLADETKKWSVLTYTQRFVDSKNETVTYRGTLFLTLESVSLSGCDLNMNVRVQDRYTGTEDTQQIFHDKKTYLGPRSQTFHYSYSVKLNDPGQMETAVLLARPAQIQDRTGFSCEEERSCKLPWLHIRLARPLIKEIRVSDGFTDLDKMVNEVMIPMTSSQAALESITTMRKLVAECRSLPAGQ